MTIKQIENWFTASTPEPTHQNFNTQAGVHVEEFAEMIETVKGRDQESQRRLDEALRVISALAEDMKRGAVKIDITDAEGFLDAMCDQIVTATGTAKLAGLDLSGALQHVADSNDSKFVDGKPLRDPVSQKIKKGPRYWSPNLAPFVKNVTFLSPEAEDNDMGIK